MHAVLSAARASAGAVAVSRPTPLYVGRDGMCRVEGLKRVFQPGGDGARRCGLAAPRAGIHTAEPVLPIEQVVDRQRRAEFLSIAFEQGMAHLRVPYPVRGQLADRGDGVLLHGVGGIAVGLAEVVARQCDSGVTERVVAARVIWLREV